MAVSCPEQAAKASHIGMSVAMRHKDRAVFKSIVPLFSAALLLSAAPAHAAFMSAYTDLDLDECMVLDADDFFTSWACPGYKGYPLMVQESDLRFSTSYGFNLAAEPKKFQTLPPVNYLGPKIEWRLSNALARWLPVATIVRYVLADGDVGAPGTHEVLSVTQLVPGNICHIAYVDVLANPDATELARQAADASGKFDCAKDKPKIIGKMTAW